MKAKEKILIVEDEFIVANDLRMMLIDGGYEVCGIAVSVEQARKLILTRKPDWVLLDITLKTNTSGIELAKDLFEQKIPFLFISANTNQRTLEAAKATQPYGFLVKPFRERDLFVMLDIARYRHGVEKGTVAGQGVAAPVSTGIVGASPLLREALKKINIVAPAVTSVLLLGESGTGKERFAEAIHRLSPRKNKPFVTVNCGALPVSLLESELFGHEKGAFTGANQRRTGKFELADTGTLFLDEVGELPMDAQVKLLRVLQEKEIDRLGGNAPVKTDVRIIAATNKNLEKEVAEGKFRLDLYYRLNVFPVELPPLRKRKEDIETLALHFVKQFSERLNRNVTRIGEKAMAALQAYDWPGNIRELEHVIERHVLLAEGEEISRIDLPAHTAVENTGLQTLEANERDHILKVLKACGGKVSGESGAAKLLGVPVQTLYSKLKKMGIRSRYL